MHFMETKPKKGSPTGRKSFVENWGLFILWESSDSSLHFTHEFVYTCVVCSNSSLHALFFLFFFSMFVCLPFPSLHSFFLLQNSVTFSQLPYFNSWWAVIHYVWTAEHPTHLCLDFLWRFDGVVGVLRLAQLRLHLSRQNPHCPVSSILNGMWKKLQRIVFLRRGLGPGNGTKHRDRLSQ